ncbi:MAG: PAS domain-containing protein, partial [Myxococcales bacterium]
MLQAPDSEWDFARALGERRGDLYFRYRLRPSPHYVYFSPRIREVVGIPAEEACADPQLGDRLVHFDDRPLLKELRKGGYRSEAPVVLRWLHVDGSVVWTEQSFLP